MEENSLFTLLKRQHLIWYHINEKIQIINFINDSSAKNKLDARYENFLTFTARIYYKTVVIELFALFGKAKPNNKNSFNWFDKPQYNKQIPREISNAIKNWLADVAGEIETLTRLRDTQMAHYDFPDRNIISVDLDQLSQLNKLHHLTKRIISLCEPSFGLDTGNAYLESLEGLLNRE